MSNEKTPYEILGVAKTATVEEIRSKYRKLARECHPDVNPGDKAAEQRFKEIASAYDLVSSSDKRKAYDEFGSDSTRSGFDPEQAREYEQWKSRREKSGRPFESEYVDLEDLFGGGFGGFSGGGFGGRGQAAKGQDIYAVAELELAQVVNGAEVAVNTPRSSQPTRVRIPKGADTGSTIRLKGMGGPGVGKGPAGDLIIETRVRPHPHVARNGLDLTLRVPVTLSEAYNGAVIEVPTFSGAVKVTIPQGSQNGSKLRLRERGIERKNKRGDFFVQLEVRMPDNHDAAIGETLKASDAQYSHPLRSELAL